MKILKPEGNQGWSFSKPSFKQIPPWKFAPVADYLSTGHFGPRMIRHETQRIEVIELCSAAWEVAGDLGMYDLREWIKVKMKGLQPWSLEEALSFAGTVYGSQSLYLDVDELMEDMLAGFIADHFWEYDEKHNTIWKQRMTTYPKLAEDVHERMAHKARQSNQIEK
ncbi:hypothetical protein K469DRAFT_623103 [Zopfia rhizophila CBS 207.26]|uniref:BTB domain-containing protein n=1 Tax=Zopfia rhizophila CBS 207.26 TaxID=1314779 RepID=A0A6A6EHA2_9PEZI|nr:hypothetical protein K469DRAFT_623103 [Zopfia rhizophila CBS 207.26]